MVKINGMTITMEAFPMDRVQIAWKPDLSAHARVQVSEMDDIASDLLQYSAFFKSNSKVLPPQDLILGFDPFLVQVLTLGIFQPFPDNTKSKEESREIEVEKLIWVVDHLMGGRTCFFTETGHFGMGPQSIEPGDVLVNSPGSRVLLALHALKEDELRRVVHRSDPRNLDLDEDVMTVVGDCYVPGLIDIQPPTRPNELRTYQIV